MSSTAVARSEWLQARRSGIGGSDAPVIMGVAPKSWGSLYDLWLDKTGMLPVDDSAIPEWMEMGNRLEPVVAQIFAERTGRKVERVGEMLRHPEIPWMLGNIDFAQNDNSRGRGVLECKTAGFYKAEEWAEEPPLMYQVQGQHYLAVTGLPYVSFGALIGGQKFVWCDVERNDEFIKVLLDEEARFWRMVETGTPPPVDGSEATTKALKQLYPRETMGKVVRLSAEAVAWTDEIESCKTQIKQINEEIKRIEELKHAAENKLKAAIGEAQAGIVPGRGTWTYMTVTRKAHQVKESQSRQLKWKEAP